MQRLPPNRIQRAYELSEIDLEENPATACLCPRNNPALGTRADFFGVHMQEGGRLLERQGAAEWVRGAPRVGGLRPMDFGHA